jgi:hypothetical protein
MKTLIPVTKAAEELLEKSGKPMHYKEITRRILHKCALYGKTPHETVRSLIGTNSKFIRVAEGVYALSKWKNFKPARFAKDIAYDVLKSFGKPMSLYDLSNRVFEERVFRGGPKAVIKSAIRNDTRFLLDEDTELVSLREW